MSKYIHHTRSKLGSNFLGHGMAYDPYFRTIGDLTPGDMVIERGLYKMRRKNEDVRTPHKLDDYEKMCSEVVVYKLKDIDGSED